MEKDIKYITIENGQEVLTFIDVNHPDLLRFAKENSLSWKRLPIKKKSGKVYYYDWFYQRVRREPEQIEIRKHLNKKNNNYEKTIQYKKVSEVVRMLGIDFTENLISSGHVKYDRTTGHITLQKEHYEQLCNVFYGLRNIAVRYIEEN